LAPRFVNFRKHPSSVSARTATIHLLSKGRRRPSIKGIFEIAPSIPILPKAWTVMECGVMNMSVPWGLLARVVSAIRQNPCTIEVIENSQSDGRQWIRIRNDSTQPVQLFGVEFSWKRGRETECLMPLVWALSDHTKAVLMPAHSFEHPVDAHEYGKGAGSCEVIVHHNRSKHPARKAFRPRADA
jgi:hypothetical protein